MIYIILGMHKSGTTLISRLLHSSNINMVENEIGTSYDKGNKFERIITNQLNKKILRCNNMNSLFVTKKSNIDKIEKELFNQGKIILERTDIKYDNWGFKDPRTCLTYDYWNRIIGRHKIIIIFRDPYEVFKHYLPKNIVKKFFLGFIYGILSLRAWHIYNENILKIIESKNKNEYIVLKYDKIMKNNEELIRLENFIGHKIQDERKSSMYRSKGGDVYLYELIKKLSKIIFNLDIEALNNKLDKIY